MLNTIILMASPGGEGGPQSLIMIGLMVVVFYFFMIRPQTKKQKEVKKFREALAKGDRIVTTGGIHGKITELKDSTAVIEIEGGNRLRIERSAISMEYSTGKESQELEQQAK